jgi:uncharacterized coiled-coil DUF342 family protein
MSTIAERIRTLADEVDQLHAQILDLKAEIADSGRDDDDDLLNWLEAASKSARTVYCMLEMAEKEIIKSGVK